uniref:Uncharacterized protein n=1 Tax=Romanomermis culicivorax TaxID=13658 RepID=A0A915JPC9_ROMCU
MSYGEREKADDATIWHVLVSEKYNSFISNVLQGNKEEILLQDLRVLRRAKNYLYDDRRNGRSFGKCSLTRDQEINFDNREMIEQIEQSDHERLCIMEKKFIDLANKRPCNILSGLGSIPGIIWAGLKAACSTSAK